MKKVLIDLSALKNVNCGFGQIALNYGLYFRHNLIKDLDVYLYVPKEFMGSFGNNVNYIEIKKIHRSLPFLMKSVDVWHTTHQRCRTKPWSLKTKNILTIHDLNFLYEKDDINPGKGLKRLQKLVDRADHIVSISNYTKSDIIKNLQVSSKPLSVIYNGVKLPKDNPEIPVFINKSERKFFFTIGEVRTKKNFHVLFDLMKILPEFDLYIAGNKDHAYALALEERIRKEQISNVFLTGVIEDKEKLWLYANCHSFLFPSLVEGFGLPVIEAMLFGKPVFLSKFTSLPEIGKDLAYYWENFDPKFMKDIIVNSLMSFYADEKAGIELKKYASTYTYERHMEQYLNLYRSIN